jgi:TM2 domain-containing membrane protein YozV
MAQGSPPGSGGYGQPPGGYGPPGGGGYGPPGGGYGPPPAGSYGAPYNPYAPPAFDRAAETSESEKTRATALVLAYVPAMFLLSGLDRMYRGQILLGILKLITLGGLGIWTLIDIVLLSLGEAKDSEGKRLAMPKDVVGTPTVNGNHVLLAGVLAGSFGVDRFMLGQTGLGVVKLLTCGGFGVWQLIDVILCATGSLRDAQGNSLRWR